MLSYKQARYRFLHLYHAPHYKLLDHFTTIKPLKKRTHIFHSFHLGSYGADLIEAEEDEVSSSLPDKPRTYRKASSKYIETVHEECK